MYAYQHMGGWFRLALYTSRRHDFGWIVKHRRALAAYDDRYPNQRAAEKARAWISEELGIAF